MYESIAARAADQVLPEYGCTMEEASMLLDSLNLEEVNQILDESRDLDIP
jgi:hypothetical protein